MDVDALTSGILWLIGVGLGLAILVCFFVACWRIRATHEEMEKQTKLLRILALQSCGRSLVGSVGTATSWITPGAPGSVSLFNDSWLATSNAQIDYGGQVRVTAVDGLDLTVEPVKK